MGFTTQIFTFAYLPISLSLYYLVYFLQEKIGFFKKIRATDIAVIALSLGFYAWACFDNVLWLVSYIALIYLFGCLIARSKAKNIILSGKEEKKATEKKYFPLALTLAFCAATIFVLIAFKYSDIAYLFVNLFQRSGSRSVVAPLGISFITFSAISYLVDIYKGKADTGSFIDCMLYLSFFAKVVSGPIVLWRDFSSSYGRVSLNGISDGITRVMLGYAKKLILADTFGACISSIGYAVDVPTAWGIALLYFLQIYYDFSGYSDIALGLSKMMGYEFEENFNFPYLSTSISEFWRRWHISLGRWFREYVYFSLGGSRKGRIRTVLNIAVVFTLTGIWHGAGWTYMLWGLVNGLCNIIEKLIADKKSYKKIPVFAKWLCTTVATFFCWQLFRAPDIRTAARLIRSMFGLYDYGEIVYTAEYYFDAQIIVLALIGLFCATAFGIPKIQKGYKRLTSGGVGYFFGQAVTVLLFVMSIIFMVNSSYSPFLYFQY